VVIFLSGERGNSLGDYFVGFETRLCKIMSANEIILPIGVLVV